MTENQTSPNPISPPSERRTIPQVRAKPGYKSVGIVTFVIVHAAAITILAATWNEDFLNPWIVLVIAVGTFVVWRKLASAVRELHYTEVVMIDPDEHANSETASTTGAQDLTSAIPSKNDSSAI